MNLPITVTQNDLMDILINVAPSRPVFIWGAPGIGKSALVEKFAADMGLPCVSLLGSQLAPEDIAGRVEVTGRGGTVLQPGVNALEKAKDFPKNAPILLITDGDIEENLRIKREHAYLIPYGRKLPFRAKGKVFYMKNYDKDDC